MLQTPRFLAIPIEIRKLVYDILFDPTLSVKVRVAPSREYEFNPVTETGSTTWPVDFESWAISTEPALYASSQLLGVCRQIYLEAVPFLYARRVFDLSDREAVQLLLHNIGPNHFKHIRHVILAWDALEDFSRALNKEEYQCGTAGLEFIDLSEWWSRKVQPAGQIGRRFASRDITIYQAAVDITRKHPILKIVATQDYPRRASTSHETREMAPGTRLSSFQKIKWRFLANKNELHQNEVVVNLEGELRALKDMKVELEDSGVSMPFIDPF